MRLSNNWIQSYLEYSSLSEAPENFHFWTAVSCIAGALRRRVWIDQGYFQWTPNFYIIFTAPPGIVSKSTTASIGMRLLREVPGIQFGPDAVTWQALTQALAASTVEVPLPDGQTFIPMSCVTIVSSELGTFLNPSDREMVDVLVTLWDGQLGTWEKETKTQGKDTIVNPWVNILACTTPAWLAGNMPDYMIGGGFTSRCIFVYAEKKRKLVAYPGSVLPKDFQLKAQALIRDLEHISTLVGEYTLHPDATLWGERWYAEHYEKGCAGLAEHIWGGYVARKQTHLHKLAIVLAASKRDQLIILQEDLEEALTYMNTVEKDMSKVFSLIGRSPEAKASETVYNIVQQHTAIDRELLYRELFHTLGMDEIGKGLQAALSAGLIGIKQTGQRVIVYDSFAAKNRPMVP